MNPNAALSTIMTKNLIMVRPDESIKRVQEIFEHHQIHHIPVVTTGNELMGIISKDDLLNLVKWISKSEPRSNRTSMILKHKPVREIMTSNPLTLEPDDTIGLAADIFLANKFRALPIVDDGQLVGMVTTYDLLAYSFQSEIYRNSDVITSDIRALES